MFCFLLIYCFTYEKMSLLGKKTLCLIAGASRGIGRAISLAIGSCLAEDSDIILMSRDKSALENVKREILRKSPGVFTSDESPAQQPL
ncbi:Sepiapterin reductase [Trichinella pseudospiralis]